MSKQKEKKRSAVGGLKCNSQIYTQRPPCKRLRGEIGVGEARAEEKEKKRRKKDNSSFEERGAAPVFSGHYCNKGAIITAAGRKVSAMQLWSKFVGCRHPAAGWRLLGQLTLQQKVSPVGSSF